MAPSYKMLDYADDIEAATRWWNDYPIHKYSEMTRPTAALAEYMTNVFEKPKRLARSASYSNLTYIKEAVHELPIKRSPSVSGLAPSLGLVPYDYRVPTRYQSSARPALTYTDKWWNGAYSPARWVDTHREVRRPVSRLPDPPPARVSHVPFYSFETKRIYHDHRQAMAKSYLRGSQSYLNRYVSSRLRSDDFANQFAYSPYEAGKPQMDRFDRHLLWSSFGANVIQAPGNPVAYNDACHIRRVYKLNNKIGRYRDGLKYHTFVFHY